MVETEPPLLKLLMTRTSPSVWTPSKVPLEAFGDLGDLVLEEPEGNCRIAAAVEAVRPKYSSSSPLVAV